jgi:hypothetical protein
MFNQLWLHDVLKFLNFRAYLKRKTILPFEYLNNFVNHSLKILNSKTFNSCQLPKNVGWPEKEGTLIINNFY